MNTIEQMKKEYHLFKPGAFKPSLDPERPRNVELNTINLVAACGKEIEEADYLPAIRKCTGKWE